MAEDGQTDSEFEIVVQIGRLTLPINMMSTKAKANRSLLKAVHLISGTDSTQMEMRLPTKPKAATAILRIPSDHSWQFADTSKVFAKRPST